MQKIQPEAVGVSTARLNRISSLLSSYIESNKIAGAISLVARRDKIVHFECQGKMNLSANKLMQEDTIFRIYSMTKPITSVAMMMLYEQGYFQLNTPVYEFIPQFKNLEVFDSGSATSFKTVKPKRPMIIADLLTHTSGLTYDFINTSPVDEMYRLAGIQGSHASGTLDDLIVKLAEMPLLFSPGTQWHYSLATEVIAYLVQSMSAERFDEFVKKNITQPLRMVDTDFYVPINKQERFAANYTHIDLAPADPLKQFSNYVTKQLTLDKTQKLILIDDSKSGIFSTPRTFHSGGGGLVSTALDYLNFSHMLLNKGHFNGLQLLSPKTVELMTTNHLPSDLANFSMGGFSETSLNGIGFGLGFSVMLDPVKANILGTAGEFGWGGGANTMFFIDPKEELIGILLMQLLPSTAYQIRQEFKVAIYQSIIR
ncbi:Esterase estB [Legionella busanensis]|uniref:Esterase estB n=1 Tax=Legionella busanensis TaxID=190655 RepID=A0A378KB85_9GAMM|nr:serine hydrolase domain-containing protein [Legionella busanensis]STX81600.1 Esterase estB [Legionella busanensis]